jgi:hypothetical protein
MVTGRSECGFGVECLVDGVADLGSGQVSADRMRSVAVVHGEVVDGRVRAITRRYSTRRGPPMAGPDVIPRGAGWSLTL